MSFFELAVKAIREPKKAVRTVNDPRKRHFIGQELNKDFHSRLGRRKYNPSGIDIFSEDWDNLIILDALRHDSMKNGVDRNDLPWEVGSRISRGSQTPEWLYANFRQRELHDVVYVTASAMPHYLGVADGNSQRQKQYGFNLDVHDIIDVWADPPEEAIDTYVDRNETDVVIPAESMIDPSIAAAETYPNKRLLIHIIQPHAPYIGSTGKAIHRELAAPLPSKLRGETEISTETIREAYRENVDLAITAAQSITEAIPGKTVISSDHGEYLLDRSSPIPIREVLHPDKTYTDVLTKVPWVEISGKRRHITADPPVARETRETTTTETNEQLAALGYK